MLTATELTAQAAVVAAGDLCRSKMRKCARTGLASDLPTDEDWAVYDAACLAWERIRGAMGPVEREGWTKVIASKEQSRAKCAQFAKEHVC